MCHDALTRMSRVNTSLEKTVSHKTRHDRVQFLRRFFRDLRLKGGSRPGPTPQPRIPYRDCDAIDLALRTGKHPTIFQKPYDISRFLPLAETVAERAVSTKKEWIEAPHSLQNIILVGGGAFLFKRR